MINVDEKKAQIVEAIRQKGPSLPIQIAKDIQLSSLFTSAILSEMISAKTIRVSNLKVGGSPLYMLPGQEAQLEKFIQYLGSKEKDVLLMLLDKKVIDEEKMIPAHRVAIRDIKDFAVPLKVNVEGKEKAFWRLYSVSPEDAIIEINRLLYGRKELEKKPAEIEKKEREQAPMPERQEGEGRSITAIQLTEEKKERKTDAVFGEKIAEFCAEKGIIRIQDMTVKKRELTARVHIHSSIGEIEMLLIAKDKKTVSEGDVSLAFTEGQGMKLPVLFLSTGKPAKKAIVGIEKFKSHLIFRQIE